jgi:phosphoribosyl 1,2-cyclic phosphodiesterase
VFDNAMTTDRFQIKLWGVRGSLAVSGQSFRKFGGNTTCIEMRCGDHVLIFDAGTGLMPAGAALKAEGRKDLTLFFTHCHYDHIAGLPFFLPLYCQQSTLRVWSGHLADGLTTKDMIAGYMRQPFFPIGPDQCAANVKTGEFQAGDVMTPYPGVTIRTARLNHPGSAIGYRIEWGGRVVALVTDTEHEPGTLDPTVLDLIHDADLFLYDSTFTDEDFETYRGFGHSTWQQGVRLAKASGARGVGFIHHAKWRTDAALTKIERQAKRQFAGAFCGRELQVIDVVPVGQNQTSP